MSSSDITQAYMTPGKQDDCGVRGCTGVTGGICAGDPGAGLLWCCAPHASTCWGTDQFDCNNSETKLCYQAQTGWCCNATLENCYSQPHGCAPNGFTNPAVNGPLSGDIKGISGAASAMPHPKALSTGAIAGIAVVGAFLLVCAVVGGIYCLRKRTKEIAEDQPPLAGETEIDAMEIQGTPVYTLPIHELGPVDTVPIHELDPDAEQAARIHELETGGGVPGKDE